jgi:O-succinylbenzoic acid--CoA ligase
MITISNNQHWLIEQLSLAADATALIINDKKITYEEIFNLTQNTAHYFKNAGIEPTDHITIISENNLDFIVTILALWLIGAIPIPINVRSNNSEIEKLVEHSKSKIILNIKNISSIKKIKNCKVTCFTLFDIKKNNEKFTPCKFNSLSIAIMLYTSGSTSTPKCVELTFINLYQSAISADSFINHCRNDLWLASLPFYHIGGFSIITRTILSGSSLIIPASLKINDFLEVIKKYEPSLVSFVPTMLERLLQKLIHPWKKLRILFIGGGPSAKKIIDKALLNSWPISLVYGSTETSSMVTVCSKENLLKNGISAGKPLKNVELEINKEKVLEVNGKKVGQIIVKSKSVGNSYYNIDMLKDRQELVDGKYFSNDLGRFDSKGNLIIAGRKDDIIISGGENISLNEIKKILSDEETFIGCEAIGVKDNKWGHSYIIISDSDQENIDAIIYKYLRTKLASFKLPSGIYRVKKIPRNELGKIQKKEIEKLINVDFL